MEITRPTASSMLRKVFNYEPNMWNVKAMMYKVRANELIKVWVGAEWVKPNRYSCPEMILYQQKFISYPVFSDLWMEHVMGQVWDIHTNQWVDVVYDANMNKWVSTDRVQDNTNDNLDGPDFSVETDLLKKCEELNLSKVDLHAIVKKPQLDLSRIDPDEWKEFHLLRKCLKRKGVEVQEHPGDNFVCDDKYGFQTPQTKLKAFLTKKPRNE